MIQQIIEWYAEPLFLQFPVATLLLSSVCFLIFALPFTLMDLVNPAFAVERRIRKRTDGTPADIRKYARFFGLFFLLQIAFAVICWPLLRHCGIHKGPMTSPVMVLLQLLFFLMMDDFIFYWAHRMLHFPWLFRRIHALHHRARISVSLSATYFHPVEYLLITLSFLSGPILVGAHVHVLYIWVALRQLIAVDGHCGYFFRWNPLHLVPFYDGSIYHDWHHAEVEGNYGLFFSYLDWIFATFSDGYPEFRNVFRGK